MAKKKEEQSKRRKKKKDIDIINDNDDLISDLIQRMKQAAEVSMIIVLLPEFWCTLLHQTTFYTQ